MIPMTSPESTYWDSSVPSIDRRRLLLHQITGLELRREDDLGLGERLLRLRVLHEEHRRRPLLPVRSFTAREADRPVPALELGGEQRLHDIVRRVALPRVDRVGEQPDLRVAVERAVDGLLLELLEVLRAERLAAR